MRALTLIRPMSAAIVHGSKRIENRPQDLPRAMRRVPTVVAVHAGKKWDTDYERAIHDIDGVWLEKRFESGHVYSHVKVATYLDRMNDEGIVGLMLLTGRVIVDDGYRSRALPHHVHPSAIFESPSYRWYTGTYGYEIGAAIAFPSPIPCRGMQGFWPVPPAIEEMISAADCVGDLYEKAGIAR